MDDSTFDRLARAVSAAGSRRRLLGVVASVGLGGLLSALDDDTTQAKRKRRGRRNSHRPGKGKRNGGKGSGQCGATGSICAQDSDCCTNNCFGFACAERVTSCGQGSTATRCQPPAKGCAGNQCCHGALACGEICCQGAANQCNPENACCVPNCAGRQCGDDGCGNGGTCGSCPPGQTCDATTGTCQGRVTCSAQNCPNGCCDAAGICQPGNTAQACGAGGAACAPCSGPDTICRDGQCVALANTFSCKCNNLATLTTCNAAACSLDGVKAVCASLCAGDPGGWSPLGNNAQCVPSSCVA
jgi:hypothetical protein